MSRMIFVLGDIHFPYADMRAIQEVAEEIDIAKQRGDDVTVVQVGDILDQRAWSKYPKDGESEHAQLEWDKAERDMVQLYKLIPEMHILFGNHDERVAKRAADAQLPWQLIKTLDQHFDFDGWTWHTSEHPLEIDGIYFIHGDTFPIPMPQSAALRLGQSVCYGHTHQAHISYVTTHKKRMFSMNVGWLGDERQSAFNYARKSPHKCWKGYGIIIDGIPHLMSID